MTDIVQGRHGRRLALFVIGSGPEPTVRQIDFLPGVAGDPRSHPVLPHAASLIANAGPQYEYGTGIHAMPAYGMGSR